MRLKYFEASKVHGYIDFKISLRDDLTFLIGINGSGKSSVLKLILGLLSPSLKNLSQVEFETALIRFEQDGTHYEVQATSIPDKKILMQFLPASGDVTQEIINRLPDDEDMSSEERERRFSAALQAFEQSILL
jgi:ABC-type cobalamin/Fe3+-siderophores transport system ATPase subunit